MKSELAYWINQRKFDVYATITLRKSLINDCGTETFINDENIDSLTKIINSRLQNSMRNRSELRPIAIFKEGGIFNGQRPHLHIMTQKPEDMEFSYFEEIFRRKVQKLNWVYNEIDIRPIKHDQQLRVILYSLKEGMKAFVPEASFI